MSNKSGIASQVVSIPNGGGSLQGIGETFSPDLFIGTGNFSVPIGLPAGRNGFQPKLNLVYSSGNGNGPFGLGWSLSLPSVTRKTSKGIPRYRDLVSDSTEEDIFLLSGTEDLVQVSPRENGVAHFRPRTEGLFARIENVLDGGNHFWRVSTRDGLTNLYGAPSSEGEPPVIADPTLRTKIFSWMLSETRDTFGNRIAYSYRRDTPAGARRWDQLYLERVQYVDFGEGAETRFLVSVTFVYDENRPDPFSSYRAGFEIRTRFRCRRIEIRIHAEDNVLVKTYELSYLDDLEPRRSLPANGVSLLSRIEVVGHDGGKTERLPPLDFAYTEFDTSRRSFEGLKAAPGGVLPTQSLADEDLETVDLFGNGLPDILQTSGSMTFWRNRGDGSFEGPLRMEQAPAEVSLRSSNVQLADMDGNGRADLLALDQDGYFPLRFEGDFHQDVFVAYDVLPTFDLGSGDTRFVDLDGDGVIDVLRTATDFELFFNNANTGWREFPEIVKRRPIEEFPDLNFSDPQVKLGDMSGDELQDIVLLENGLIQYWPYLGHGQWGRRIKMSNSPVINDELLAPALGFDPKRLLLGDVDGDGLDDLVYLDVAEDRLLVWINQAGNGWSDAVIIKSIPPFLDPDAVRIADILGTGTAGVLWTAELVPGTQTNYRFLDITGSLKPYLLTEMNNNMGAVTRVQYAASTKFYQLDEATENTRWRTHLPFPVQVVDRVEVIDEISKGKLTTEYRYHHGYWDGIEREFRGFGRVDQLDTESFERFNAPGLHGATQEFERIEPLFFSPPTLTKTWFHLGPLDDEVADNLEIDLTNEYFAEDPPLLV